MKAQESSLRGHEPLSAPIYPGAPSGEAASASIRERRYRSTLLPGRECCRAATLAALAGLLCLTLPLAADEVPVQCTVVYTIPGGLYINAGRSAGLRKGDRGQALRDGVEIARVEVAETTTSTARLLVLPGNGQQAVRIDDAVVFLIDVEARAREEGAVEGDRSPTLRKPGEPEPPIPLLALPGQRQRRLSDPQNVFHGKIWVNEILQTDSEKDADYSIARLGTAASLERIDGTPWALEWSADLTYRDGQALEETRDYREPVVHVYRFDLFRRWADHSFVRAGRFLPLQLPAAGYLDGLQGEKVLNKNLRVGGMVGLKPERRRLDVSLREPTVVPYMTLEAGDPDRFYYSGTAGVLASLYEGKASRLALLLDQSARINSRLSILSTCEADMDVGGAETRSGVSLTHLDLFLSYRVTSALDLRGGVDHYEFPDNRAERDLLPFEDDLFFDRGYWRSFVGASRELPGKLRLDGEVSWIDPAGDDPALRWRVSLTRRDLPFAPGSTLTLSAYKLEGSGASGYAGRIHANFRLLRGKLSITPSFSYRTADIEGDSEDFDLAEASLGVLWRISPSWSAHARFSRAFGTETAANILDIGLSYRW